MMSQRWLEKTNFVCALVAVKVVARAAQAVAVTTVRRVVQVGQVVLVIRVDRLRSFDDFQSADFPIQISELITTSSMLRILQSISKQEQLLMAMLLPQLD